MRSRDNRASIPLGSGCVPVLICAQGCSARDTCRKGCRARRRKPCWKEHPPTTGARAGPWREISKKPTPGLVARAEGGVRAGRGEAAASAVVKLVIAAAGGVAGIVVNSFGVHFRCPLVVLRS